MRKYPVNSFKAEATANLFNSSEAAPFVVGVKGAIQRKVGSYGEAINEWNTLVIDPDAIVLVR